MNDNDFAKLDAAVGTLDHVCYRVEEIESASSTLKTKGYRSLGTGDYKRSNHGKRMIFLRPPDLPGPLVKLEEQ